MILHNYVSSNLHEQSNISLIDYYDNHFLVVQYTLHSYVTVHITSNINELNIENTC